MPPVLRGEVWFADLGTPTGHEQGGGRPVVVLQIDQLNGSGTTVIVPTTTLNPAKPARPTEVRLNSGEGGLTNDSIVKCDRIRVLAVERLRRRLGRLPRERMSSIESVVAGVLGLP